MKNNFFEGWNSQQKVKFLTYHVIAIIWSILQAINTTLAYLIYGFWQIILIVLFFISMYYS